MLDTTFTLFGWSMTLPGHAQQLLLSALIGIAIGLERELKGKIASLRTFTTISLGSCLFTLLSLEAAGSSGDGPHDVTRIAAQIVTGVGFLGGGVIFKASDRIEGITTAAFIWLTAAYGMACGFNKISMVLWALLIFAAARLVIIILYGLISIFRNRGPRISKTDLA